MHVYLYAGHIFVDFNLYCSPDKISRLQNDESFLNFTRKWDLTHFMLIVSIEDNLHGMLNPVS